MMRRQPARILLRRFERAARFRAPPGDLEFGRTQHQKDNPAVSALWQHSGFGGKSGKLPMVR
jgi:hypothetical protein